MTKKTVFAKIEKSASKDFDATFVMSAADLDRTNDTIDPKAYDSNTGKRLIALWQHDHAQPVGYWEGLRKQGRQFVGDLKLASTELARMIKQLLDDDVPLMASIGFSSKEAEYNDQGGTHFKSIDIYECSVVSVGAHPQAIRIAKSYGFDIVNDGDKVSFVKSLATSGNCDLTKKANPHALGKTVSINSPGSKMKSFTEQIAGFTARKNELSDTVKSLLAKAADEGRTLDADEAEKHDTAMAEIDQVEKHLGRLASAEKMAIATAKPVVGDTQKAAQASRSGVISVRSNELPGLAFARYAKCIGLAKGNLMQAEHLAKSQYPEDNRIHTVLKAAVSAGSTTGATWAAPLVEYQTLTSDFIEYLRNKTIIGRFGQGGIPALRQIPFNVRIAGQSSGAASYWTGEGAAKGVTSVDFNTIEFGFTKVAAISVMTEELLRFSNNVAVDTLVRDTMVAAMVERLDADFINPAKAAVAGVSPASITNGLTAVVASGTTIDDAKTDIKALFNKFITAKLGLSSGVWVIHPSMALSLGMATNALGNQEFPGLGVSGGVLMGMPVITSEHTASGTIVLLAANEIYIAQDGISVDVSREASIEMADNPTGNSKTPTGSSLVSLWQTNSVGLRVEQMANWKRRRDDAVAIITGANYSG